MGLWRDVKKKIYENQPIDVSKLGSEYAFSKLAGENIVKFYCNLFNIKYVILNLVLCMDQELIKIIGLL